MNGLPYYKKYPRDFFEGTAGMPFELKGAYALLLDLIYVQSGHCPDDPHYISGALGCSVRKWKSLREGLLKSGKIQVIQNAHGSFLNNVRASFELDKTFSQSRTNAENRSRPNKNNDLQSRNATYTDTDTDKKKRKPSVSQKKGQRLPEGWFLPKAWGEWSVDQGMTPESVRIEADKFADYWHAASGRTATKLDWFATWRNWCRKAIQDRPQNIKPNGGSHGRLAEIAELFRPGGKYGAPLDSSPSQHGAREVVSGNGSGSAGSDPERLGFDPREVPEGRTRMGFSGVDAERDVSAETCGYPQAGGFEVITGGRGGW